MLSKIEYVYEMDKINGEVQLLGAKVFSFDGEDFQKKEIYVGISYSLDEICSNAKLAASMGIEDIDLLIRRVKAFGAVGIIYFPQARRYEFLEATDVVLPYTLESNIEETLEQELAPYRNNTISQDTLRDYVDKKYGYIDSEDSLSELYGLPLSRQKVSAR